MALAMLAKERPRNINRDWVFVYEGSGDQIFCALDT